MIPLHPSTALLALMRPVREWLKGFEDTVRLCLHVLARQGDGLWRVGTLVKSSWRLALVKGVLQDRWRRLQG